MGMAIYTTELLTDRDYNIPEGRLPLEYAVDCANKSKTHSENTEAHVSAADREAWNAAAAAQSGGRKVILYRYVNKRDVGGDAYYYDLAAYPASTIDPQTFLESLAYPGIIRSYWYERIGGSTTEVLNGFLIDAPAYIEESYLDFSDFTGLIESLTENGTMIATRLS